MSETTNTTEPDLEARVAELRAAPVNGHRVGARVGQHRRGGAASSLTDWSRAITTLPLLPSLRGRRSTTSALEPSTLRPGRNWRSASAASLAELCILMDSHDNLEAWVEKQLGAVPMDGDRGYSDKELRTGALSPTHARTYDPEAQDRLLHRVAELEGQVFQVGKRLNDSIDWRPDPGNFAQAALWNRSRVPNGIRGEDKDEPTGCVLEDLSSGALRVTSWAQLLDCLQMLASNLLILVKDHDGDPSPFPPANQKDKDRVAAVLELAYGPPVVPA